MVLTIAVVALAAGAVAEFQIGILRIRPAADGALVPVGPRAGGAAVIACPVGIRPRGCLGAEVFLCLRFAVAQGIWQQIGCLLAKEEEIVGHGQQREQAEQRHPECQDSQADAAQQGRHDAPGCEQNIDPG